MCNIYENEIQVYVEAIPKLCRIRFPLNKNDAYLRLGKHKGNKLHL